MTVPNEIIQFKNCQLLRDHKIVTLDLWVRNGKIIDPEKIFFDEQVFANRIIDCNDAIIAPGFIDLQINGKLYYKTLIIQKFSAASRHPLLR